MRPLILVLLALILGAGGVVASTDAPVSNSSYVLVPGDVIDITVSSHQGYDREVTIQPDGKIQMPVAGEIMAAGLTTAQLVARLQEGLNAELIGPRVIVSVKELNHGLLRRVSILGAVKIPNSYELKEKQTLAELLATAGGPTPVANLSQVTITRAEGRKKITVDLSGAARTGEVTQNVALEPGDLIIVPEGTPSKVLLLGEVVRPGSYDLEGAMRVLDALSAAGGPTTKADLRRVTLNHAGQPGSETIDLQELLTQGRQKNMAANVLLRAGDTLIFPENERKFYVLGDVTRPEAYPLKSTDRLLDAITTAGGSTQTADLTKVVLIRKNEKGQPVAQNIDLKRMLKMGDMSRNDLLQAGDVIYVPNARQKRPITDLLGILYPLTGVLNFLR